MREGNPAPARRFRLASPATVLVLACLVLALLAAGWPLAGLAHQSVNGNAAGLPWWFIAPFAAYAIVTSLLVGVYSGLVLLATEVHGVHGSVAVAAATLAAAALFAPVRRRVQHAVDRRFNRARYDAEETVAAFAARLKDAVDLDTIRGDLAEVVRAALEPAHVAVWTRPLRAAGRGGTPADDEPGRRDDGPLDLLASQQPEDHLAGEQSLLAHGLAHGGQVG